ncbi:hypothetical protein Aca07nite_01360 [Actinoplanes capillaceus]|uniref:SnoaL-like domain-containing protein n=1 Tax=Actinoplanes campanulatus TaxID=113559 RepID=A0ABQ3WAB4_9ACTN|nr:nuclear transport factor 2 family protein [Actinoplanes capillaceus]GID42861.1 hypothetical protein Aca07nite_01360 [Actinoplanes capillaceus]
MDFDTFTAEVEQVRARHALVPGIRCGIGWRVELTHQEIFERYVYAGAVTRNPDSIAEMFTEDGVFEAPLVPDGHPLHRPLVGRPAIRAGMAEYHRRHPAGQDTLNVERSAHVLHETGDPDVFIAEIDVVFDNPDGSRTMSLVQIFRLHGGRIARLRDYFSEPPTART